MKKGNLSVDNLSVDWRKVCITYFGMEWDIRYTDNFEMYKIGIKRDDQNFIDITDLLDVEHEEAIISLAEKDVKEGFIN